MAAPAKPRYKLTTSGAVLSASTYSSSHVAADTTDQQLRNWTPIKMSADADLLPELDTITGRSRDIERNNGIASGGIQTLKDNIIGSVLKLSAKPNRDILGWSPTGADAWARKTEGWFDTWFGTTECDASNVQTGWGLSHLALSGAFLNGAAIAVPVWKKRAGGIWGTRLKIIEADRLETPSWLKDRSDKRVVRAGVEIDNDGEPLAYWIRKKQPNDNFIGGWGVAGVNDYERIPAVTPWGRRRVIHLFDRTRAGQTTGRPIFTSVMRELKIADRYTKAELDAAVGDALVIQFLESVSDPQSVVEAYGGTDAATAYDSALSGYSTPLGSSATLALPYGVKQSTHTPSRPNAGFDQFMTSILRKVASGLNMPYEVFAKDFSKTSYASARAALMEAWRFFMGRREWFMQQWLYPIYELWLEEAVENGRVDAPDYYTQKAAYLRSGWIMAGRGWIDPWREARASEQRMASMTSTLERECAEQGQDWREVLDQRRVEDEAIKDKNLVMPTFVPDRADDAVNPDGAAA